MRDLEALPYVERAEVVREWPDTVRIVVRERQPAAWIDAPAGKAVVDGTGRVLEVGAAPPAGLPQLLGTRLVPPVGGTVAPLDGARVAGGLSGYAAAGTASVEVTDHGVLLHLASGPEVRMGRPTQVAVKLARRAGGARRVDRRGGALRRRERAHQPGRRLRCSAAVPGGRDGGAESTIGLRCSGDASSVECAPCGGWGS